VRETRVVRNLLDQKLDFEWVKERLPYDEPAKTLDTSAGSEILLFPKLVRAVSPAEMSIDLVSPYFVPGEDGAAGLATLAKPRYGDAHPHQLAGVDRCQGARWLRKALQGPAPGHYVIPELLLAGVPVEQAYAQAMGPSQLLIPVNI